MKKNQGNTLGTFCALSTLFILSRAIKKCNKNYFKKVSIRGIK